MEASLHVLLQRKLVVQHEKAYEKWPKKMPLLPPGFRVEARWAAGASGQAVMISTTRFNSPVFQVHQFICRQGEPKLTQNQSRESRGVYLNNYRPTQVHNLARYRLKSGKGCEARGVSLTRLTIIMPYEGWGFAEGEYFFLQGGLKGRSRGAKVASLGGSSSAWPAAAA